MPDQVGHQVVDQPLPSHKSVSVVQFLRPFRWSPKRIILSSANRRASPFTIRAVRIIWSQTSKNFLGAWFLSMEASFDCRFSAQVRSSPRNCFRSNVSVFLHPSELFAKAVSGTARVSRSWHSNRVLNSGSLANLPSHGVHHFNQSAFLRQFKQFPNPVSIIAGSFRI
jgi:hypothetical protein